MTPRCKLLKIVFTNLYNKMGKDWPPMHSILVYDKTKLLLLRIFDLFDSIE